MKKLGFFLMIVALLSLVGCDDMPEEAGQAEGWNPRLCTEKSSEGCGVDWFISIKGESIPKDLQIVLNDVVIIDECDPKSWWSMSSISDVREFKINDYIDMKGTETINMRIFDLKECKANKTEKGYYAGQNYTVKNVSGKKRIVIERVL